LVVPFWSICGEGRVLSVSVWRERLPKWMALGPDSLVKVWVWRREVARDIADGRVRGRVAKKVSLQAATETRPSSMPARNEPL
jgi:hypothetical protein